MGRLNFHMKRLFADKSGLAGIEFALASTALTVGLLNGLEVARWSFQRMELANAVHSATLAAWNACDTKHLPASTKCTGLSAAVSAGLATTSLGTGVTLATGYPKEGYYCVNSSGALQNIATYDSTTGALGAKPTDCTAAGDSSRAPGDYVVISASYTYTPLFGQNLTVGSLLTSSLTSTGYIRLQ